MPRRDAPDAPRCVSGKAHHWHLTTEIVSGHFLTTYECEHCGATKYTDTPLGASWNDWPSKKKNTQGQGKKP